MKILVTGGLGNVGQALIKKLVADHSLRAVARRVPISRAPFLDDVEVLAGDITSKEDMLSACEDVDCVIHLAAIDWHECAKNPRSAILTNGFGTRNVLDAAVSKGVSRFIYVSSIKVYGSMSGVVTEDTATDPLSDYAIGKLLGEFYCRQYSDRITTAIVRISNSFGAPVSGAGWDLIVNELCKACFETQKVVLRSSGLAKKNFIPLSDVLSAIDLLLSTDSSKVNGRVFNLGASQNVSIRELSEMILLVYKELYDKDAKLVISGSAADVVEDFSFDYSRIRDLGFEQKTTIRQGIIDLFRFLESDCDGKR